MSTIFQSARELAMDLKTELRKGGGTNDGGYVWV